MGKDLYERFPEARRCSRRPTRRSASALALCFEGPEDELKLTANTQPAILTVSAALRGVREGAAAPGFVAGPLARRVLGAGRRRGACFADAVRWCARAARSCRRRCRRARARWPRSWASRRRRWRRSAPRPAERRGGLARQLQRARADRSSPGHAAAVERAAKPQGAGAKRAAAPGHRPVPLRADGAR